MSKSYFPSKRLTAIALAAVSISWAVKVRGEQNLRLAYISAKDVTSQPPEIVAKMQSLLEK